ncbi:MAG TPA: transposase [Jiangellaceae bacterium]
MITIGIDPHKNSLTAVALEPGSQSHPPLRVVVDTNTSASLLAWAKQWPDRQWAVEGANGAGRPLAQRLLETGEHVVDVPAKLAARVRLFDTGHNRKTDALDAHSIAIVAVRTEGLRVLKADGELEAMRMLTDPGHT